jgi:four helix bundle protein
MTSRPSAPALSRRRYRDLRVWQEAMQLAEEACAAGEALRRHRWHALADQIERAASAVPANLAEGSGRSSPRDFARYVAIAGGSLRELETHLLLARRGHRLSATATGALLTRVFRVARLLNGLHRTLSAPTPSRLSARRPTINVPPHTP